MSGISHRNKTTVGCHYTWIRATKIKLTGLSRLRVVSVCDNWNLVQVAFEKSSLRKLDPTLAI